MSIQLKFFLNFFEAKCLADPDISIIDGNNEPMCCEEKKQHPHSTTTTPNPKSKF